MNQLEVWSTFHLLLAHCPPVNHESLMLVQLSSRLAENINIRCLSLVGSLASQMFTIIHVGCIQDDFSWNLIWLPVFLQLLDLNPLLLITNNYILNVNCFPAWCCCAILCLSLFVYR